LEFKVLDFSLVEEIIIEIHSQGNGPDLVLTGRNPSEELLAYADYITNMAMERHPFEQGQDARLGIEF
jgi:cob(I)alamin adenosyltransferase